MIYNLAATNVSGPQRSKPRLQIVCSPDHNIEGVNSHIFQGKSMRSAFLKFTLQRSPQRLGEAGQRCPKEWHTVPFRAYNCHGITEIFVCEPTFAPPFLSVRTKSSQGLWHSSLRWTNSTCKQLTWYQLISYHDDIHLNKSTRTCGLLNLLLTLDQCFCTEMLRMRHWDHAMRAAINLTSLYPGKSV